MTRPVALAVSLALASAGCHLSYATFDYGDNVDAGLDSGSTMDAGRPDAGQDSGPMDSGSPPADAGADAGSDVDAGECPGCTLICVAGTCVDGIVDLRAGMGHTCALRAGGGIVCWGDNREGELGDGTMTPRTTPTFVPATNIASIDTSNRPWSCAVETAGRVLCWGSNDRGALGIGGTTPAIVTSPGAVLGIADATHVGSGSWHGCAIRTTGAIVCWGFGASGALGTGNTDSRLTATSVAASTNADQIASGGAFNCARQRNGSVLCWGSASQGQTGQNPSGGNVLVPTAVPSITDAEQIVAGTSHACVRRPTGVYCWGSNSFGQLGVAGSSRHMPTLIAGTEMAIDVDAGNDHSCAVLADGGVVCWGDNFEDQLGGSPPGGVGIVRVAGLPPAVAVAAGGSHTCAALRTGGVMCWGRNMEGQLGIGMTSSGAAAPVAVVGLP